MTLCQIQVLLLVVSVAIVDCDGSSRGINSSSNSNNQIDAANDNPLGHQDNVDNSNTVAAGIAGYLLAEATDRRLNVSDPIDVLLSNILNRNGPDMRPMRDFRDFDDITTKVAERAWNLMHTHAKSAITSRVDLVWPIVEQALAAANVSSQCNTAARDTFEAAKRLDSWAIQILTSWGSFPPAGIYEGTFGDIGSYHSCVDVPTNPIIGHAHYCSISYRPVMPTRRDFELIIKKEPDELLRMFDRRPGDSHQESGRDAFSELVSHSQYNHYVYYKLGTCFPIQCSPFDVQRLAKLLGRRSILMSGPVKCHSKYESDYDDLTDSLSAGLRISTRDLNDGIYIWKPHMTRSQWVSLVVVATLTGAILVSTLLDVLLNRRGEIVGRSNDRRSVMDSDDVQEPKVGSPHPDKQSSYEMSAIQDENNNVEREDLRISLDKAFEVRPSHLAERDSLEADGFKTIPLDDDKVQPNRTSVARNTNSRDKKTEGKSLLAEIVGDCSIITNAERFLRISEGQLKNDILCINGIRCITMSWIIITHTMQYNDWSAFARIREIETHLRSLVNQPLFNASCLVDTFFLMSGLLTSFSTFQGLDSLAALTQRFSARTYLIGRYLRLTPQILFVSLLFILLPQLSRSGGPHWYTITGEYSENCQQNWWVNLLHIQAFYRSNEMCNFVCWWVSVDMLYHLFALAVILLVLRLGHRWALASCALLIVSHCAAQLVRHYQASLPPNLLSTIPQTGAMWSDMTLAFFWMPYAHALPFFLGLYVGYLLAQRHALFVAWFTPTRAAVGWLLATGALIGQSYSTYFWVIGSWQYSRPAASAFYLISSTVWALSLTWIILACHLGYGGPINRLLSCRLFLVLGKASYMVYLSHFLVLFTFFGSQNLLLEPTQLVMFYVILGNICLSMILGSLICVIYEMPLLSFQRRIMRLVS